MKTLTSSLLTVLIFLSTSFFNHLYAETQFIRYKNYLIPIATSLRPVDNDTKARVVITTDLSPEGDQDDYQTLVHALLNSDKFDLLGIVSSIPGAEHNSVENEIQDVVRAYQADFDRASNQVNAGTGYTRHPVSIVSRGSASQLPNSNPSLGQVSDSNGNISAGAQSIIDAVYADKSKPLYVLGWGSLTDVAIAIIKDSSIVPYLRLVTIGSTNSGYRSCCSDFDEYARDYLYDNYTANSEADQNLWWVEIETAFRGLYGVDNVIESYESDVFQHVSNRGCLGKIWKDHDKPGVAHPYNSPSTRPFSGDYLTTLFIMDPVSVRNDPSASSNSGKYYNDTTTPALHWTERNQDIRGSACGEENSRYGRPGGYCWGAEYIYQKAKNEIKNDFIAVSNRLETIQSYCP